MQRKANNFIQNTSFDIQTSLFTFKVCEEMNGLVILKLLTYEFVETIWKLMAFEKSFFSIPFLFRNRTHFVVRNAR